MVCAYFLCLPLFCHAGCEDAVAALSRPTSGQAKNAESNSLTTCKIWRAHPEKTIVAIAKSQAGASVANPSAGIEAYDLDVLIVSSDDHKILQRFSQKAAWHVDANQLTAIAVDTAPYLIGPNADGFGISAEFLNHSRSNPSQFQTLNVYVADGAALKQILSNLVMRSEHSERLGENCVETSSKIGRTLIVSKTRRFGYADLIIDEKSTFYERDPNQAECKGKHFRTARRDNVRFNGQEYVIPKSLQQ